jgi:ferredoxin--NADP+ reductase
VQALRAAGFDPVPWSGWLAIRRAEAALGARLGRSVVKLADWNALRTAARSA